MTQKFFFLPFSWGEIKWNFYASLMGDVKLVFPLSQSFLKTLVFSPLKHLFCWSRCILKNARMTLKLDTPDLWDIKPCRGVLKASYLDHTRTKCVWCSVIAESRTPIKEEAPKWTMEKEAQDIFFLQRVSPPTLQFIQEVLWNAIPHKISFCFFGWLLLL